MALYDYSNLGVSDYLNNAANGFTSSADSMNTALNNIGSSSGNSLSGLFDTGGTSWLQDAQSGASALGSLANIYLGFSNLSNAKSQAAQQQANWNKQWAANVKTTNASLSDRQAARVASNPNAYESVDSYMKKYGIS